MSEKQIQFNFNVMVAPNFSDLQDLESKITTKDQYLTEISKTKKELNQLGALLNSTVEDVVYDEVGNVKGIVVDTENFEKTNTTISDVMDNENYQGNDNNDNNYNDRLLPPSCTAAYNLAISELNDEADTLGLLGDLIANDLFIQDLLSNQKDFVNKCEKFVEEFSKIINKISSQGEGEPTSSAIKEGSKKVLQAVLAVALDKFDLDKITNQLIGDKIDLVDQAIIKYTSMDQTGLAGSLRSKYNITFRSLTSNIFKKTYSGIKDVANKGTFESLTFKSTREAAKEGLDKIFSTGFYSNFFGKLADQAKMMFNKSIVGVAYNTIPYLAKNWDLETNCYKLYLVAMAAHYALKNNLMDAVAARALLTKVTQDFIQTVLKNVGKGTENAIDQTMESSNKSNSRFSDITAQTNTYDKDVYNFLNKIATGSTYSSLTRYVDLFQRYALNNHNTGLKTINVQDNDGVFQIFEYMKNDIHSNSSDLEDEKQMEDKLEEITNSVSGVETEAVDQLTGEVIDVSGVIKNSLKKHGSDAVDIDQYIHNFSYNVSKFDPTKTEYWKKIKNQVDDSYLYWDSSIFYQIGDRVNYKNKCYECIKKTTGETITSKLSELNNGLAVGGSNYVIPNSISKTITYTELKKDSNGNYIKDSNGNYVTQNKTITFSTTKKDSSNINISKASLQNITNVMNETRSDLNLYKKVLQDYKETVINNNEVAFKPTENKVITYRVDNPKELSQCVNMHIQYRTQKLEILANMNKLYFNVKSE